ncbi:MAG: hypothetical protein ABIG63_18660 [Chloroflexota bacterium]
MAVSFTGEGIASPEKLARNTNGYTCPWCPGIPLRHDIWFLIRQGVRLDIDLLNQKLVLYDLKFSPSLFESALENVRTDWERDLRPLLAQPWSWDEIVSGLDELRKL